MTDAAAAGTTFRDRREPDQRDRQPVGLALALTRLLQLTGERNGFQRLSAETYARSERRSRYRFGMDPPARAARTLGAGASAPKGPDQLGDGDLVRFRGVHEEWAFDHHLMRLLVAHPPPFHHPADGRFLRSGTISSPLLAEATGFMVVDRI